jgi:hypothetical protein
MPTVQKDLFGTGPSGAGPLVLTLRRIPAPRNLKLKTKTPVEDLRPNYHIPSFKNAKRWVTKDPRGKPLKKAFLITSPEFQKWREKAVQSLESQLLSSCRTTCGETPLEPSKLLWILSRLPADDSVNDLPEGSWKVIRVPPGEEGAIITIERLK